MILRNENINKKEFMNILNYYLNDKLYERVRKEFNIKSLREKNILYKIINSSAIKAIYYKEYDKLWSKKKYLKLKDILKKG